MKIYNDTPHINLLDSIGFGETVLMPGDPKRSEYIAKNFLSSPVLVNDVRGVAGYTGFYKGKKVSCMASGMGLASMSIYSYELFNFFDVQNIIRVGTIGALDKSMKLLDIVAAISASTDTDYQRQLGLCGSFSAVCSYELLKKCEQAAKDSVKTLKISSVLSGGLFYNQTGESHKFADYGICGIEMEAYALYCTAAKAKRNALAICTVSDIIGENIEISAKEREQGLENMITLALDIA